MLTRFLFSERSFLKFFSFSDSSLLISLFWNWRKWQVLLIFFLYSLKLTNLGVKLYSWQTLRNSRKSSKNFLWASRLWVGGWKEPVLSYVKKINEKKNPGTNGLIIEFLKCDIEFLKVCQENNLTPKFVNFKLYKKNIRSTCHFRQFQNKLINNELSEKEKNLKKLRSENKNLVNKLRNSISYLERN